MTLGKRKNSSSLLNFHRGLVYITTEYLKAQKIFDLCLEIIANQQRSKKGVLITFLLEEECLSKSVQNMGSGDFPGSPVAKILCSQSRGPEFNPWSGN